MINIIQQDKEYVIKSEYDPQLVEFLRSVPGRMWHKEDKVWTIPKDNLGFLLNMLKDTRFESQVTIKSDEEINRNQPINDNLFEIPDYDLSDMVGYYEWYQRGSSLLPHQQDFMKFALYRQYEKNNESGFIVADQPGLGKTLEAINLAMHNRNHYGFKHCLIICCVNSAKFTWLHQIPLHTNNEERPYIIGTRIKRDGKYNYDGGSKAKLEDLQSDLMYGGKTDEPLPYFLITNIESIRYRDGKVYPIKDQLIQMIQNKELQMIVIDEVHTNMSMKSQQGKCILDIKKKTGNLVMWLPMSGTPINTQPTDMFLPLRLIDAHDMNSYWSWCQQYCIYGGYDNKNIIGYKNMKHLKSLMHNNMIRRLKSEVLDLPDKIFDDIYVENTAYQSKLYGVIEGQIKTNFDAIVAEPNPLVKLLRLRQVNGNPELIDNELNYRTEEYLKSNAKLQRLLEILAEIKQRGEKVLIFSNWVQSLRTLYYHINKTFGGVVAYTGTMPMPEREESIRKFMEDNNITIMMGTIQAMGVSHTLTAATNVIFYDEPWVPNAREQAIDRCLTSGNKITTPNGFINIEDIKVGDLVFTHTGQLQPVIDCWNHEETVELVEIQFYGNPHPVTLTSDHLVLTVNGWKAAGKLRTASEDIYCEDITKCMGCANQVAQSITHISTGFVYDKDMYCRNNFGKLQFKGHKNPIPECIELTDDFLYFCGYYLGDGHSNHKRISLAGNFTTKLTSLQKCKQWYENNIQGKATFRKQSERNGNWTELNFYNASFSKFIADTFGDNHTNKHFPQWIYNLGMHQLKQFYLGLVDSDGYHKTLKNSEEQWYTTVTPALAAGVWWLFSRLGYKPRIYTQVGKEGHKLIYNIIHAINPKYRLKTGRIRSIRKYVDTVRLYDITVKDDQSFYAYGTPLHNCHRLGTTSSIHIYTLITQDTIDERIHDILYKRGKMTEFMFDETANIGKNTALLKELLNIQS